MLERKKRLAAILLAAAVSVASAGSIAVSAEEGRGEIGVESFERQSEEDDESGEYGEYGDYSYVLKNGTIEISKYNGTEENIIVPSQIDGKDVTRIDANAFYGNDSLASITIPGSIKSIGWTAFFDCDQLNSVTLAEGLEIIEEYAFSQCRNLSSIDIPESVTSIGEEAFANCDLLSSITVPKGVESIGPCAFSGSRYVEINVDSENSHYASVDGCLCNKEKTKILECDKQLAGGTLPAGITSIGKYAFSYSGMEGITLPDGLVSIEDYAFYNSDLTSITIPKRVTNIGKGAFVGVTEINVAPDNSHYVSVGGCLYNKGKTEILACSQSITELALPEGLTGIGDSTFKYCRDLTSVTLPKSLKNIGNYAFEECLSLSSITLPDGLENIGECAFRASGLSSVTIPESVASIGYFAFGDCDELTVNEKKGPYYEYSLIEDEAVEIKGYYGAEDTISVPSIVAGKKVWGIGNDAFQNCSSVKSITLPEGVVSIEAGAFRGCSNLSITIPESVTEIEQEAFSGNVVIYGKEGSYAQTYALENDIVFIDAGADLTGMEIKGRVLNKYTGTAEAVVIPDGVTEIKAGAFDDCSSVKSITIPKSVEKIGGGVDSSKDIHVFGGCSSLEELNVDAANEAYASQDGILYNKEKTRLIRCPRGKSGALTIPEGVTEIGVESFHDCGSLTSISIPKSVTQIQMLYFKELIIDGLYQNPFEGCNSLKELKVAADNKNYASENGILYNKDKTSLLRYLPEPSGTVDIPANVKYIGAGAFAGYTKLTDITIPQGATSIGYRAFYGCSGLKSVVIPESVTSMAPLVFRNDDHLTGLTIYGKAGSYAESYAKGAGIKFSSDGAPVGKKTISGKNVSISPSSYVYDGKAKKPAVTVKYGNTVLKKGTDYTVDYRNNKNAGTAKVIITGKGNYTGTVTKTFTITVKKGSSHTVGDCQYKVTGASAVTVMKMNNKKAVKVTIPKTVKIGGKDFKVTAIEKNAFKKNTKITSVVIGDNVKTIGTSAFEGCAKLTKVTVGKGVMEIGGSAFKNCKKLGTVTIKSTKLKKVGKNALKGIKATAKIKVPVKKLSDYKKLFKNKGQGKKVKIVK